MRPTPLFVLPLLVLAGCAQAPRPPAGDGAHTAAPRTVVMQAAPPIAAAPSAGDIADGDERDAEAPIRMAASASGDIDCDGRDLNIVGRDATLVLHGHCATVSLFGRNGNLQIERADTLRVLGDNAQIAMRGDAEQVALFGRHGRLQMARIATLDVSGDQNQLQASEIDTIALQGNGNAIVQRSGSAQVDDSGRDNRILVQ
ncbi:hypothetical protein NB699_001369 [Xanthomonas sacchari]|uniref:DUF3060 domain-containing protein n=1 Tax=Xanthomonas sacchari TaxID=56458 RepID=A0AA46SSZ0_9XANT|nr:MULTISPECIES: DUF3060 domain-containing protein [Xanthomonas]MCW0366386.1 hypothetical protein [Xanthomonas sacchari]MCW0440589.1 hypothetical protein [Xanthomonas sacchari]MDY4339617.1 DUF3060 domain-containing protein [Xanthomonas sp. LF07-6]UYK87260.1 DUF3060 domain-containing protein [Xanthomonas sacchari]